MDSPEPIGEEPVAEPSAAYAESVDAEAGGIAVAGTAPGGYVASAIPVPDVAAPSRGGGSPLRLPGRILSMPVEALRNRLVRSNPSGSPDFDAFGNPHKPRRVTPFWIWFAGFYVVVALAVAATLLFSGARLPGTGPAASRTAFAASPPASGPIASGSSPVVGQTLGSPSTTTLSSGPLLAVKEQPPTLPFGKNATFVIQFVPGSTCTLTRTFVPGSTAAPGPTPKSPVSSLSFIIGASGSTTIAWGENAQVGTYTINATCTGSTLTSAPVTFSWT